MLHAWVCLGRKINKFQNPIGLSRHEGDSNTSYITQAQKQNEKGHVQQTRKREGVWVVHGENHLGLALKSPDFYLFFSFSHYEGKNREGSCFFEYPPYLVA